YQFLFNFINYFSRNLDNILIGKVMGASSLGYYDKAYKLMLFPIGALTSTISGVMHPILAKHQDDKEIIFVTYMKVVKLLAIVGISLSVYLFFSSEEIIGILYGNNWAESIPIFKILSISVCIQMVLSSSGTIFQALGRTDYLFYSGTLSSVLTVSSILYGLYTKNLKTLSYALVISFALNFIQCYYLMIIKTFGKTWIDFFVNFRSALIIGMISLIFHILILKINMGNMYLDFVFKSSISLLGFIIGAVVTGEYKNLRRK
ncbi:MAG: oligosaccharide flippase family protein, partial [Fusobacteriaceae bacterium]